MCCGDKKEVELRSRRGKFIYSRTYNSVGLNKVSYFSRRDRAPSRLTVKNIKIVVTENTEGEAFCMERYSEKYSIVGGNSFYNIARVLALCKSY